MTFFFPELKNPPLVSEPLSKQSVLRMLDEHAQMIGLDRDVWSQGFDNLNSTEMPKYYVQLDEGMSDRRNCDEPFISLLFNLPDAETSLPLPRFTVDRLPLVEQCTYGESFHGGTFTIPGSAPLGPLKVPEIVLLFPRPSKTGSLPEENRTI